MGSCPLFVSDVDASKASDLHRTGERRRQRGIVVYDHLTIGAVDWSSPHQTARVSRGNSSLKTDVFSLLLLTFDRIVKQLSNFEGRS